MWITTTNTTQLRQEFAITNKISDYRGETKIEIYNSKDFGNIALINESIIYLQNYNFIPSEFLSYASFCLFPYEMEAQSALLNSLNLELAYNLLKCGLKVDLYAKDEQSVNAFVSFFPSFSEVINHPKFKIINEIQEGYDIIISDYEIDQIAKTKLNDRGIYISRSSNFTLNLNHTKARLKELNNFEIVMPFSLNSAIVEEHYIYASKRYHPTADLCLQKIDMLEATRYYNAAIHTSAFALNATLKKELLNLAKN